MYKWGLKRICAASRSPFSVCIFMTASRSTSFLLCKTYATNATKLWFLTKFPSHKSHRSWPLQLFHIFHHQTVMYKFPGNYWGPQTSRAQLDWFKGLPYLHQLSNSTITLISSDVLPFLRHRNTHQPIPMRPLHLLAREFSLTETL